MLALLSCGSEAHAAKPHGHLSHYVRQQWMANGAFPGGPVRTITQTPDGFLWLGTQKGLIRFDGLDFRMNSLPLPSFQNDQISDLVKGPDGKLWAVFWGAGILRYNDGRLQDLTAKFGQPGIQVTASSGSHDGSVLLADGINGIERIGADGTKTLAPANALPGYALVLSIAESKNGIIWLGTASQGLFSLKDGHVQAVASSISTRRINCLLPVGENELWLGAESGLLKWDGARITRLPLPKEFEGAQVLTMLEDRQSNVWVGTTRGLARVDKNGAFLSDENSFGKSGITALFEDSEGNIWAGGPDGLERLSEKTLETYSTGDGLPTEFNGPVHVDDEGHTWVAPLKGGVYEISNGSARRLKSTILDRNIIYSITSHNSDLWMGTQNGGLLRVTNRNGTLGTRAYTQADGLGENSVYSVFVGRDGAVWAGTLTAGVSRLLGDKFVTYTRDDGLASNTVSAILQTYDGVLWFATPNGLSSLSSGHWKTYGTRDGLISENVNCLFEDKSGALWVGTSAGLTLLKDGHVRALPDLPASLRDQIYGITEDLRGRLWLETATRILRVRPETLSDGTVRSLDVREYDTSDGVPGIEGVRRNNSITSGAGGQIWFSLRNGVTMIDSARNPDNSIPALTHVDMISADNNPMSLEEPVRIPASPQRITFDYTAVSLETPERVRFRYFLQGFDNQWSNPLATREAVYTNLVPGSYVFRLMASNIDGTWKGSETQVAFRIDPAFWQTGWFRTLMVGIVLVAFWLAYRLRTYRLTQQLNARFLERLAERNRIAQELHDTLLQGLQAVILHFESASQMLPASPDEAKQILVGSLERADQTIAQSRDAIMDLRSTPSAVFDMVEALRALIAELCAEAGHDGLSSDACLLLVQGIPRNVRAQVRDEISRIAREAIRNAIKHAMARQISAEITFSKADLRLVILDNGKGIEPRLLEPNAPVGHWGLLGMRERAAAIGGTLEIASRPGEGTAIMLTLPANLAYELYPVRSRWRTLFLGSRSSSSRHG